MHWGSVAARFLLVSTALLWADVLCAESRTLADGPKDKELFSNNELVSLPKKSSPWSPWLRLNEDLLICICHFCGPVHINTSDRKKIIKILVVLTTLSRLFEHLFYVGAIESDEALALYPLLSEISLVKKRSASELPQMLIKWPLPKGNLTLSLLISTGQCSLPTLKALASYCPHIANKPARLAAVNHLLDDASRPILFVNWDSVADCRNIFYSAFDSSVLSKLRQTLYPNLLLCPFIASSLLHLAPADLDGALVEDLDEALAHLEASIRLPLGKSFCTHFAEHPVILRDPDSMQAIFKRNAHVLRNAPFSAERWDFLSVLNKIKFGASQDITNMNADERELLLSHMFWNVENFALVFHIWAREDVEEDGVWAEFANDLIYENQTYEYMLPMLAFDPERLLQDHFDVDLFEDGDRDFCLFLEEFKHSANSSKKQQFHTLLRAKVQEHSETVRELFQNLQNFESLVDFFTDQGDKNELMVLNELVFEEITVASVEELDRLVRCHVIARVCHLLGGRVDGGCINDPLRLLAERIGAAKVLPTLDFSLIRPNNMGEMLRTLVISRAQIEAALSSLFHETEAEDELAAVLRKFHNDNLNSSSEDLPTYHSLWFYLWKEHQEAFIKYVHLNIQQPYRPEAPKLEPVR